MGDPWSNQAVTLIILTEQVTGFSGLFGYSPTVAKGNLVFSVAAIGGTTPQGDTYYSGVCSYASWSGGVAGAVSQVDGGIIQLGAGAQIPAFLGGNISGGAGVTGINSGGTTSADHQAGITLGSQGESAITHGQIVLGAGQIGLGTANAMNWNDNAGTLGITGAAVLTGSVSASAGTFGTVAAATGTISGGTIAVGGATFTQSNINLDPGMGIPADDPLSQISVTPPTGTVATWAANVDGVVNACVRMVGTIFTEMQNRGFFA